MAVLAVYGCSKIKSATKSPAVEFQDIFGLAPPATVADIRYHERSSCFAGWTRWMSFTCDAATLDALLKKGSYKQSTFFRVDSGGPEAPAWWPEEDPTPYTLYSLGPEDTPEDEGFQFSESIWYNSQSGRVYFTKSYWD